MVGEGQGVKANVCPLSRLPKAAFSLSLGLHFPAAIYANLEM